MAATSAARISTWRTSNLTEENLWTSEASSSLAALSGPTELHYLLALHAPRTLTCWPRVLQTERGRGEQKEQQENEEEEEEVVVVVVVGVEALRNWGMKQVKEEDAFQCGMGEKRKEM